MRFPLKMLLSLMLCITCYSAQADYVCKVTYRPNTPTLGYYGYVTMFRYSAPDCGGVFTGSHNFCSNGATYGPCADEPYQYSERGLLALYDQLIDAMRSNMNITVIGVGCVNGGSGCGAYVDFNDN